MRLAFLLLVAATTASACRSHPVARVAPAPGKPPAPCVPIPDSSYLVAGVMLPASAAAVRASAEEVFEEFALEVDSTATTRLRLVAKPTFRWPPGMDSTKLKRHPGVIVQVFANQRADSTLLRVGARTVCTVGATDGAPGTRAEEGVVATTLMLMVTNAIVRRHPRS